LTSVVWRVKPSNQAMFSLLWVGSV
jgi:hypothetical protein